MLERMVEISEAVRRHSARQRPREARRHGCEQDRPALLSGPLEQPGEREEGRGVGAVDPREIEDQAACPAPPGRHAE
jgi:hypothetical protein